MRRSQTPKTTPTAISGAGVHQPSQGAHPSSTANWSTNVTLRSVRTRGLMSSSRARPSSSVSHVAGAVPWPMPSATATGLVIPMTELIGRSVAGLSGRGRIPQREEAPRRAPLRNLRASRPGLLVVVGRHVELGELVGEAGVAAGPDVLELGEVLVEPGAEAAEAVPVAETQLGGDLVLGEQADLVHRARQRLGRLDLDAALALEAGRGRDELADDHVLLQPVEGVLLAIER